MCAKRSSSRKKSKVKQEKSKKRPRIKKGRTSKTIKAQYDSTEDDELDQSQMNQPVECFVSDLKGNHLLRIPQIIPDDLNREDAADQIDPLQMKIHEKGRHIPSVTNRLKSATEFFLLEGKNETPLAISLDAAGDEIVCDLLTKGLQEHLFSSRNWHTEWARKYRWVSDWRKFRYGNKQDPLLQKKEIRNFWELGDFDDLGSPVSRAHLSSSCPSPPQEEKSDDSCESSVPLSFSVDSSYVLHDAHHGTHTRENGCSSDIESNGKSLKRDRGSPVSRAHLSSSCPSPPQVEKSDDSCESSVPLSLSVDSSYVLRDAHHGTHTREYDSSSDIESNGKSLKRDRDGSSRLLEVKTAAKRKERSRLDESRIGDKLSWKESRDSAALEYSNWNDDSGAISEAEATEGEIDVEAANTAKKPSGFWYDGSGDVQSLDTPSSGPTVRRDLSYFKYRNPVRVSFGCQNFSSSSSIPHRRSNEKLKNSPQDCTSPSDDESEYPCAPHSQEDTRKIESRSSFFSTTEAHDAMGTSSSEEQDGYSSGSLSLKHKESDPENDWSSLSGGESHHCFQNCSSGSDSSMDSGGEWFEHFLTEPLNNYN